jgi:excisionase family DNA binding protein
MMEHGRDVVHVLSTRSGVDRAMDAFGGLTDWRGPRMRDPQMPTPRFLTLADVAEILNVSWRQVYALVRRKELVAIQIGGRGQWRVEVDELERFIQERYAEARAGDVPDLEPETESS